MDTELLHRLEAQEADLVFSSFDHLDAWRLGTLLTERALEQGLGVAIDIRRGDHVLFRSALPGTTVDQQEWIRRKSAIVRRFEVSSALTALRLGTYDSASSGWLDPSEYVLTGGSFPIRVAGVGVIGTITASGLTSERDHELVTDGIATYLTTTW